MASQSSVKDRTARVSAAPRSLGESPYDFKPLVSANRVWDRVKASLVNEHWAIQQQFDGLREHLATQGGNPSLLYLAFVDPDGSSASLVDGQTDTVPQLTSEPLTLYGLYVRKVALDNPADNVDQYFKCGSGLGPGGMIFNGHAEIMLPLFGLEARAVWLCPDGLPLFGIVIGTGIIPNDQGGLAGSESGLYGFAIVG